MRDRQSEGWEKQRSAMAKIGTELMGRGKGAQSCD